MKKFAVFLLAGCVLTAGTPVFAQRGAASKITGTAYEAPYFYASAGAYQDSAYNHANLLSYTASYGEPVVDELATEHTAAIRRDLTSASKKYESLRPLAKDNPQALEQLDAIAEHHKQALALTDEIDGHVQPGAGDPAKVRESARKLSESLQSAQSAHQKLMSHLKLPAPVKKPAAAAE
jgi:hypothetical protein